MRNRPHWQRIAGTLLAMLVLALVVLVPILRDQRGTEVTRYRNALLAERGNAGDFDWTPANWPADFQREHAPVPSTLQQWHGLQQPRDINVWSRTLLLAKALTGQPRKGNMIAKPTLQTLQIIERSGAGYCADYTKVLNALGYAADIPVRQWSFSFDGFGGWGHTFNEIWDESAQRWRMIDVFNGFYPRDAHSGDGMSALEFRQHLLQDPQTIVWERLEQGRFGFRDDAEALAYFRNGANEWYLWWGNDPLSYDSNAVVAFAARFGRLPEQVAGLLTGAMPGFKILLTDDNAEAVAAVAKLKTFLLGAALLELVLFGVLVWQVLAWRKSARR